MSREKLDNCLVNVFMGVSHSQDPQIDLSYEMFVKQNKFATYCLPTFLKIPNSSGRAANVRTYLFLLSRHVLSI